MSATPKQLMPPDVRGAHSLHRRVRPDWLELGTAYDEAVAHLINCAAECEDDTERRAYEIVARRIQAAGNRLRPNSELSSERAAEQQKQKEADARRLLK